MEYVRLCSTSRRRTRFLTAPQVGFLCVHFPLAFCASILFSTPNLYINKFSEKQRRVLSRESPVLSFYIHTTTMTTQRNSKVSWPMDHVSFLLCFRQNFPSLVFDYLPCFQIFGKRYGASFLGRLVNDETPLCLRNVFEIVVEKGVIITGIQSSGKTACSHISHNPLERCSLVNERLGINEFPKTKLAWSHRVAAIRPFFTIFTGYDNGSVERYSLSTSAIGT
ncbi:unnamed protein product, partial [Scytosiphon promiscuus]